MAIIIRRENPEDRDAVRAVSLAALGRPEEADIADLLRNNCADYFLFALVPDLLGQNMPVCR